ncbi:hypothetical protein EJ08DRAFT_578341 [Tothia fuscella]|uniref:non-specific serine/threonine protein kinase n=1 Tax=Tothia fuscella TaxID=1048955 RepID=A0A9P4P3Y1_9PEZI|nr:hypothetical protein EJ08DRAFT_578341 [Tothia fuscella]
MSEVQNPTRLAPPAVSALKQETAGGHGLHRNHMQRSITEDFRVEKEDLKEAAEHSHNVILNLSLDGVIRFVTPSWREVIGTIPESVIGKPMADLLVENKTAFQDAIKAMQQDDSKSHVIRFSVTMGPFSSFRRKLHRQLESEGSEQSAPESLPEDHPTLSLEAQGIMVFDRASGSHTGTMWMIRPYVVREVTIDLPAVLVESLGVGAEMLAHYLTELAEAGVDDPANHPPPSPVLCRICERQITPWWFEKHTELCLQEHTAEMDVQIAHESLSDHRAEIVKVLDALDAQTRQPRAASSSGELAPPASATPEYKGLAIGQASTPSSGPSSVPSSGRASPASPSHSRDRSSSSFGHHRARSFAIRRPLARIVELVLDLCDTALEINTPALSNSRNQQDGEFRTQSPQSESRAAQVLQWHSPSTSTVEHEQGLALLCEDTNRLAKLKVDAIFRHRHILEYSERIRIEFAVLVQECIEAAIDKAARIAAGELSDSGDSSDDTEGRHNESQATEIDNEQSADERPSEEEMFPGSFEGQSAMTMALRNASNPSLVTDRRPLSAATSTRSSSPRGSQTPRSFVGPSNLPPPSKRGSIYFESDAGADSDSSVISTALSLPQRTESPGSDLSLSRVHTSRDRNKRRSLILPSVMSSRQHSPARGIPPPSSPLRMAKSRIPSESQSSQSPITSPVMSTSEFSSPFIMPQHIHMQHHRRQSSAASSDVLRPSSSPRLAPVNSNPQPRAVPPSIKDFEIIKPISKGAFGSVYLSKKKSTGDYFAIKVLKKADMVAKNQVTNVKAERAIMMWQGESDFVAKLYWTFSSKDYLYLVMEYLNGGDCASLIKVLGGLPEDWSKKYIAEVVLGVEHLHSRGIVHRDLKPDNLLIDQKGHLKLTDFGLSRMGVVGRQKRALNSKSDEPPAPDLLKQGPFHRAISVGSSRSASFDLHGNYSPSQTPSLTAAVPGDIGQPSYFSLTRESSRKTSGQKTDSETSEGLHAMFRKFSLVDDTMNHQAQSPIEEETGSGDLSPPELYTLQSVSSHVSTAPANTPPTVSGMLPPTMALFDPQDTSRKFVGTPDYLAPETIKGIGQDEVSDWWSLGCILFEILYGYPPFHDESPDLVFQNILARKIDWPPEDTVPVSDNAKDLINKLMSLDPAHRLGANAEEKFETGGAEIRNHPWFEGINWESLRDDEASFVPAPENPEDTEYFDARGAELQSFAAEFEDQVSSPAGTPGADYPERPHDALARVRTQVNNIKRGLMPLHIPPHVRMPDGRSRRLSEPIAADDFGNFSFKNLPVLEKANKDVIQKLRAEALQAQNKPGNIAATTAVSSPSPSLESSPILPMPLKRTISANKGGPRPSSPLLFNHPAPSPSRPSQPSSPLLVQFSAGQNHERRKASSGSSTLSQQSSNSLQPGNFFDAPRMMGNLKSTSSASSPIKLAKSPGSSISHERSMSAQRLCGNATSPRPRSHTVSSQESEDIVKDLMPTSHKRRSAVGIQMADISPSSSDNEDSRQKAAFLRVQRRRQSSRRMSQITLDQGPMFRPLDVLVCEDHPVSRLVMEKLLEKHRCRTITAQSGSEAMRYAMSEVKFDIIMMEYKLPQINGADVARMIRDTKNANTNTPIICVTGYLKELPPSHHFDGLVDKPPTLNKLSDILSRLCQWKPPPANWTPTQYISMPLSGLRQESARTEDSPTSNASSYGANMPSGSYRGSSREDSISSSFFGDGDSRVDDFPVMINKHSSVDWQNRDLTHAFDGLGITEDLSQDNSFKPKMPALIHQESAPATMEHTARRKPSAERNGDKRRSMEKQRRESADSGDDEDEELGNVQLRARSPKGRPRGTSKLGTEMLRTNSRGSVVSVEDVSTTEPLPNSPPPAIAEERREEEAMEESKISITPPELFPRLPGAAVEDIVDMDVNESTPKPQHNTPDSPDPDPTPRPSISSTRWVSSAESSPKHRAGSPAPRA